MGALVGAIDEGTSSARFILFKAGTTEIVASYQQSLSQIYPQEGWVEQDPIEILDVVNTCIEHTIDKLISLGGSVSDIAAIGVTNQRESTIVWEKSTGMPLYNSIVWLDVRTSSTVDHLLEKVPNKTHNKNYLKPLCGLPLSPYFSAVKLRWLQENVPKAKATYGTGCFLLYNTGKARINSQHGLVTTVAYQIGSKETPVYALEGSVAIAGAALNWLRDNMDILPSFDHAQDIAEKASLIESGEVYFVPAFSGLYAPYWQQEARGVIVGISEDTQASHIVRATLDAVCFQTRDILEAMNKDCKSHLTHLQVDGGMTANTLLMQLQSDLTGITVIKPEMAESTCLGAAMVAGAAVGVWDLNAPMELPSQVWEPKLNDDERDMRYSKWNMAIEKAMGWDV
ncbi:glycerol kinase isoform X2 [Cylas formicarius]|uniref:glycerol kinase isoform X2 n=1 Tax=Cylas formicarius TaxID=197179 RepID=UPI0029586336|nr:glycerol kinase isoform X2 [Cylas formicarius]